MQGAANPGPTQAVLDPSAELLERVAEALGIACFEWWPETDEMRTSTALVELLGYPPEAWASRQRMALVHPDDMQGYRDAWVAFFKSDAPRTEFTLRARVARG